MAISLLGSAGLNDNSQSGSKELPFYCDAGSNRKLLIGFVGDYSDSSPVSSATYATTGVGTLIQKLEYDAGDHQVSYLWYIDNADLPASAGTHMVTVTLAGTVSPMQMYAAAYSGMKQGAATNIVTAISTSSVANSLSITTHAEDALIFSLIASEYNGTDVLAPTSGQTELQEYSGGVGYSTASAIGHESIASPGEETSSWQADGSTTMGQIAVELEPASSSSIVDGVGTIAGTSTCTGVGAATATGTGTAAGTSTCTGIGDYTISSDTGVGTSAGTSTVTGIGAADATGVGTSTGTATATGIGAAYSTAVGAIAGTSTCTGIGSWSVHDSAADLVVTCDPYPSLAVEIDAYPILVVEASADVSLTVTL